MANSLVPDQTAPIGAGSSGSMLFASILNSSVMLGNYLQQTTSADDIFRCIFFLGALRVKTNDLLIFNIAPNSVTLLMKNVRKGSRSIKQPIARLIECLTHISLASFLWDICKQFRPRPDAANCGVCSGSPLFA